VFRRHGSGDMYRLDQQQGAGNSDRPDSYCVLSVFPSRISAPSHDGVDLQASPCRTLSFTFRPLCTRREDVRLRSFLGDVGVFCSHYAGGGRVTVQLEGTPNPIVKKM
jgi:hypothetical protein